MGAREHLQHVDAAPSAREGDASELASGAPVLTRPSSKGLAERLRLEADLCEADGRARAARLRADADEIERGDDRMLNMTEAGALIGKSARQARAWLVLAGAPLEQLSPRNTRVRRSVLERLLAGVPSAPESGPRKASPKTDERAQAAADAARDAEKILRRGGATSK